MMGEAQADDEGYSTAIDAYSKAVDDAPMKTHAIRSTTLAKRALTL